MNKSLLGKSFLTLCSNLTIVSLVFVTAIASFMLPIKGQSLNGRQVNAADHQGTPWVSEVRSRSKRKADGACQNGPAINTNALVASPGQYRHAEGATVEQPGILDLETIIVDSVIFQDEQTDTNRLTFYLANCSASSGLVQMRSEVLDLQHAISKDSSWERRRVPRYDYLVHTVSLPQGLQPSSVRIYLRADDSSSVIELEVAGSRIKKSAARSSTGELYTDNRTWR